MAFLGPNELSVIERCPYYRGVRKERLDCTPKFQIYFFEILKTKISTTQTPKGKSPLARNQHVCVHYGGYTAVRTFMF